MPRWRAPVSGQRHLVDLRSSSPDVALNTTSGEIKLILQACQQRAVRYAHGLDGADTARRSELTQVLRQEAWRMRLVRAGWNKVSIFTLAASTQAVSLARRGLATISP